MSQVVGTNLTPVRNLQAGQISSGINKLLAVMERLDSALTGYGTLPSFRVFTCAAAPAGDEGSLETLDSPGCDFAFVICTDDNDLYFCYKWVSATSFLYVKVWPAA